jgi:hypothetical protein
VFEWVSGVRVEGGGGEEEEERGGGELEEDAARVGFLVFRLLLLFPAPLPSERRGGSGV